MKLETKEYEIQVGFMPRKLKVSFPDTDDPVSGYLKNHGLWATDLAMQSSPFWTGSAVILDIGAHIGTYSLIASTITSNKVIAIEASPTNFEVLKQNKEQNNLNHLEIHNIGAGDKEGTLKFVDRGSGAHIASKSDKKGLIEVPVKRLDDAINWENGLDFIKIDIEGFEINALNGLENTINKFEPPILFETNGHTLKFFDKTPNDLFRVLEEKFGYRIFVLAGNGFLPMNCYEPFPFGVIDCFALKDKHIQKIMRNIMIPLSFKQRVELFAQTEKNGNEDIKNYVKWYAKKVKF